MKKNLLIIASNFPPSNRVGGVIRISKLIKYLNYYNWSQYVITTRKSSNNLSLNLLNELKNKCVIYRIPEFDIRKIYHFFKLKSIRKSSSKTGDITLSENNNIPISSHFLVPDHLLIWSFLAFLKSIIICLRKKIDLVLVTSPAQSGLLTGLLLKFFFKKTLIVDYRDPWTTNPFHIKRFFTFLNKLEDYLEYLVLKNADCIVVINRSFISSLQKKFKILNNTKFKVITNGFDPEDFSRIKPHFFSNKTIVHAGNFYFGRSPIKFFKAFSKILFDNPLLKKSWQLILVGSGEEYKKEIKKLNIINNVKFLGNVPHEIALSYMLGANILLLIPGLGKTTMTGKVFEYMAAKKPIFVSTNKSAVSKLINDLKIGVSSNENNISECLLKLMNDNYDINLEKTNVDKYSRMEIAKKYSKIMDDLLTKK